MKIKVATAQPLVRYAPEIEARRADYQVLAENMIALIALDMNRLPQTLDIVPPGVLGDEPPEHILLNAINDHINSLFENYRQSLILNEDFLRIFYVELRLYYDQEMLKISAGEFRRQGGKWGRHECEDHPVPDTPGQRPFL